MKKNKKINKLYIFYLNFSRAYYRKYLSDFSASAAFFIFLSMIPLLMVIFSIIPYTGITEEMLLAELLRIIPEESMKAFISGIVNEIYISSGGVFTISIIVTIWSAGKGMNSMIRGLNNINEIEENRGYFLLRAVACLYTLIMLVAVFIMMGLLMFGRTIMNFLVNRYPAIEPVRRLILNLRYPVAFVVLILIFLAIYCLVPSKKQKFIAQLPGAVLAALVWGIASFVFSFYVDNFNGFSTYGSMATIIIVMVYMYMMMYIILYGAYLNHWLGRSVQGENK